MSSSTAQTDHWEIVWCSSGKKMTWGYKVGKYVSAAFFCFSWNFRCQTQTGGLNLEMCHLWDVFEGKKPVYFVPLLGGNHRAFMCCLCFTVCGWGFRILLFVTRMILSQDIFFYPFWFDIKETVKHTFNSVLF